MKLLEILGHIIPAGIFIGFLFASVFVIYKCTKKAEEEPDEEEEYR